MDSTCKQVGGHCCGALTANLPLFHLGPEAKFNKYWSGMTPIDMGNPKGPLPKTKTLSNCGKPGDGGDGGE